MNLLLKSFFSLIGILAVMGALLFGVAGTLDYWQAWVFLAVWAVASVGIIVYLMKRDPTLLRRRMAGGPTAENSTAQRIIMSFASAGFFALLIVPALDKRLGWSAPSPALAVAGEILILAGWIAILFVFRANSFASATIEVASGQRVISTGPYGLVRHPMYGGALVYMAGIPLALGSWWGLIPLAAMLPVLAARIADEEKMLVKELPGYADYCRTVRWRMAPFLY